MTAHSRVIAALAVATVLRAVPAGAEIVGHPGAPTPAFSMRLSAGLAYNALALANEKDYRDAVSRLLIVGRVSIVPLDWLEILGTVVGADAHRSLTEFDAGLHFGGGGALRLYPMLQEKFGVNLGLGGGANFYRNDGTSPLGGGVSADDALDVNEYHGEFVLSRNFQTWNLYGGAMWQMSRVSQSRQNPARPVPTYGDLTESRELFPVGMFVGVDYFVTPMVFFSLEGQNFHTDAISAGIGMVVAP